jgi:tetratricopeptide (TPR) repeat protein
MEEQVRILYYRLLVALKTNPWIIWVGIGIGFLILAGIVAWTIRRKKAIKIFEKLQKNPKAMAEELYRKRDFKKALPIFLEIGNFEMAADCLEKMGKLQDSARLYEKAQKYGKAAEIYLKLKNPFRAAECYIKEGKHYTAAEIYEKGNEKEKAALTYMKGEYYEKAATLYAELQKFKQSAQCWLEAYKRLEGPVQGRKKDFLVNAGKMLIEAGEIKEGVELLKKAGETKTAGKLAEEKGEYSLAGECYEEEGLFESAARAFKNAGDERRSVLNLARFFESQGDFVKAGELYEKIGNWADASSMFSKGGILLRAAEASEKGGFFREAGEIYLSLGMKEKAGECFEKAGEYERAFSLYKETQNYNRLASLLVRKERFIEAANLYFKMKLYNEAMSALSKISETHENYKEAVLLKAKILEEQGKKEEAVKTIEGLLKNEVISEKTVDMFYYYATLVEKAGDTKKALAIYTKISELNPSFRDVAQRIKEIQKKTQKIPVAHEERYEILEEVGRGGMGIVYKARDKVLNRIVAYKVLPITMKDDEKAIDNFYREARAAAALNHPNIVTIHDFGIDKDGQYYITMEFIEGETIKAKIKKMQRLPVKFTIEVAKEVCKGLHFAHSKNILHRDIKSANIMIAKGGYVKIMDFGLAKILHDAMSAHTVIGGTPHYMSPEQLLGEPLDGRADIYSLGITMYEMITGRVPFTKGDIGYHHIHTPPPKLSTFLPSVPPEVEKIVMKCIEKKRENRFQSVAELFEALKALKF